MTVKNASRFVLNLKFQINVLYLITQFVFEYFRNLLFLLKFIAISIDSFYDIEWQIKVHMKNQQVINYRLSSIYKSSSNLIKHIYVFKKIQIYC